MIDTTLLFRGQKPSELSFGTSGLRGLVTDITDLEAYLNTAGFLEYLKAFAPRATRKVVLGGDLRPSTDGPQRSILRAVARAVLDAGFELCYVGKLPTPALAFFGFENALASIMVTGSHIPFDRNGIKFNLPGREVLKADEAPILRAVAEVRASEYRKPSAISCFDDRGMFLPGASPELPPVDERASRSYRRRYLDFFPGRPLSGLRLAVYQHSAVGRDLLPELFEELGASVHPIGRSEEFVAIDTEAISKADLAELSVMVSELQKRVGPLDALVSTDGDSDRPLLLAIDAVGGVRFVGGDLLGILVAEYLGADAIAVPVSATDAIDRVFSGRAELVRTRIGSPWVIAAFETLRGKRKVGWEANGGFLVGSSIEKNGRVLAPLPTRDAVLPLVCVLARAREERKRVGELLDALPARVSLSGLVDVAKPAGSLLAGYFDVGGKGPVLAEFDGNRVWFVDRRGQRQSAGAAEAGALLEVRARLARQLSPARGFGSIRRIDFLDGVRCYFEGGEIAHVRASGNAPQLRIYAVSSDRARAERIIDDAISAGGTLEALLGDAERADFVAAIERNIAHTEQLFLHGEPASLIGTVCGSRAAQRYWQDSLDAVKESFRAERVLSLHEDLPTNQAFGLLLMWQRLSPVLPKNRGALMAFVFGEGSRATPFTETDSAQKPAIASFVHRTPAEPREYQSMVGLALHCFAPVEAFLRRSGFDGVLVKWGDEVQIPVRDVSGSDPLFRDADIVRFVSLRAISADDAVSKDWVGVDTLGRVTAFIPRRPLSEMRVLADRGLLQRRGDELIGGINLGSIAASRALLDLLLEEFREEVNDASADRKQRPDLDPQFFTVFMIALSDDPELRLRSYSETRAESPAIAKLDHTFPELLPRLGRVIERFVERHGRKPKVVAMDFGDQYWGDIGQHRQIYDFYTALNQDSKDGQIARALAGLKGPRDAQGNLIAGSTLSPEISVKNSVLIDCELCGSGSIEDSVLIGTRAGDIVARSAFDILSVAPALELEPRAGSYKVVSERPLLVRAGERVTTLFLPDGRELEFKAHEDLDLRDRAATYDVSVMDNPLSFAEAHAKMGEVKAEELGRRRNQRAERVLSGFRRRT